MNNAQRALAILNYQPYDRMPVVHFGYWSETLDKWVAEGHLPKNANREKDPNHSWHTQAWSTAGHKLGFDFEWDTCIGGNGALDPQFETKTIQTFPDGSSHVQNRDGVIILQSPDATSIPAEIDHLLKDRASWEEHYKPRLQWSPKRIPKHRNPVGDAPQGLFCGSMIGTIRDILGVVGLSYLMADDEELLDEIIQTFADLALQNVKTILASGEHFEFGHFWEDICFKNGPLVNPAMFAEKIGPHYKRITQELNQHGINLVSVDCDGCIDDILPIWLENGANTMFPIEVGTWNASIQPWREKYGKELRGVGGMNKNAFAMDRAAIDAEIERLKPLIALGGYLPCPDHRIPPTADWNLVCYYCEKMHALNR